MVNQKNFELNGAEMLQIVKDLCNYKIPEPLRKAHNLAKKTFNQDL